MVGGGVAVCAELRRAKIAKREECFIVGRASIGIRSSFHKTRGGEKVLRNSNRGLGFNRGGVGRIIVHHVYASTHTRKAYAQDDPIDHTACGDSDQECFFAKLAGHGRAVSANVGGG